MALPGEFAFGGPWSIAASPARWLVLAPIDIENARRKVIGENRLL